MITTPLLYYVCSVFLKIFGSEMIVLRVLEIIEIAGILFIMYKIMQSLKINKGITILAIIRNI